MKKSTEYDGLFLTHHIQRRHKYFILFVFTKGLHIRRVFSSDHKIAFRQRIHKIVIRFPCSWDKLCNEALYLYVCKLYNTMSA